MIAAFAQHGHVVVSLSERTIVTDAGVTPQTRPDLLDEVLTFLYLYKRPVRSGARV